MIMKKILMMLNLLFVSLIYTKEYSDSLVPDNFLAQYGLHRIDFVVCEERSPYEYTFLCKRSGKNFDQYLIFMKYKHGLAPIPCMPFQELQSHLDWIVWRGDEDSREFFVSKSTALCVHDSATFDVIYSESHDLIMQEFKHVLQNCDVKITIEV